MLVDFFSDCNCDAIGHVCKIIFILPLLSCFCSRLTVWYPVCFCQLRPSLIPRPALTRTRTQVDSFTTRAAAMLSLMDRWGRHIVTKNKRKLRWKTLFLNEGMNQQLRVSSYIENLKQKPFVTVALTCLVLPRRPGHAWWHLSAPPANTSYWTVPLIYLVLPILSRPMWWPY
jgi:hypothetical protein